jgi:hypothetical protein
MIESNNSIIETSERALSSVSDGSESIPDKTMEHTLDTEFTRLQAKTMDLRTLTDELKNLHQSPDEYWYAMGTRLQKILTHRLYRSGGFSSFSDYCTRGLGYSRQHIYKLIKVANFIDQLWSKAETPKQRKDVERLFTLGFTKLYVLHSLPASTIEKLLDGGIETAGKDGKSTFSSTLEVATISQLKRGLYQNDGNGKGRASLTTINPSRARMLLSLVETQARSLLRFVLQWKKEAAEMDGSAEKLQIIEQYASLILQGTSALSGNTDFVGYAETPMVQTQATILFIGPEDENFKLICNALEKAGIKAVSANTLEEAGQRYDLHFDLIVERKPLEVGHIDQLEQEQIGGGYN